MNTLPSGISQVLFDAGNTLLFIDYPYLSRVARQVGSSVPASVFRHKEVAARIEMDRLLTEEANTTDESRWRRYFEVLFLEAGLTGEQFQEVAPILYERHQQVGLWIWLRPWTRPVLRQLKDAGYRMSVVSNADGRVKQWLERKGLAPFMDTVIDSQVVGVEKPDPRIFEIALDRTGLTAKESLYVGDIYAIDVVGARRAGIEPVLLDPFGMHPADDCLKIRRLADLLKLLPRCAPVRRVRRSFSAKSGVSPRKSK